MEDSDSIVAGLQVCVCVFADQKKLESTQNTFKNYREKTVKNDQRSNAWTFQLFVSNIFIGKINNLTLNRKLPEQNHRF